MNANLSEEVLEIRRDGKIRLPRLDAIIDRAKGDSSDNFGQVHLPDGTHLFFERFRTGAYLAEFYLPNKPRGENRTLLNYGSDGVPEPRIHADPNLISPEEQLDSRAFGDRFILAAEEHLGIALRITT